jgi:hypothetical protein
MDSVHKAEQVRKRFSLWIGGLKSWFLHPECPSSLYIPQKYYDRELAIPSVVDL